MATVQIPSKMQFSQRSLRGARRLLGALRLPPSRPRAPRRQQSTLAGQRAGSRSSGSTSADGAASSDIPILELRRFFVMSAVPMVGFGLVDNTVMIQAGNAIDLTLGVTFGLSTLAAAACGQICSDVAGVAGAARFESAFARLGLPRANLTAAQLSCSLVKRVGLAGQLVGVFVGCSLGLVNLLFLDTGRTAEIKAVSRERSAFSIHVSNGERENATAVTVHGPDAPMLVASLTAVLAAQRCDVSGFSGGSDEGREGRVRDVFYVTRGGAPLDEAELEPLAQTVLDACADAGKKQVQKHLYNQNPSFGLSHATASFLT